MANPTASRSSGVAPLYVAFDASTYVPGGMSATNSFHFLQYAWDFDDTAAGSWTTTGLSRDAAKGGVAGHVFRTPGTYTVALTVTDGTLTDTTQTFVITVDDPAVIYDDALTICYGPVDSEFDGAPADSTHVESLSFNTALDTLLASPGPRRILLQRGQTFTFSGKTPSAVAGPFTVGAFGSGADPIVNASANLVLGGGVTDFRIIDDIYFDGTAGAGTMLFDAGNETLLWGCTFDSFTDNPWTSTNDVPDQSCIAECTFSNIGGQYAIFLGVLPIIDQVAILACTLHEGTAHTLRSTLVRSMLQHNIFTGVSSLQLKFAGTTTTTARFCVISDNKFMDNGASVNAVRLGPTNDTLNEPVRDIVFERNTIMGGASTGIALILNCSFCTVRNNILRMEGVAANNIEGIYPFRWGTGVPEDATNNWIYNNTGYRDTKPGGNPAFTLVRLPDATVIDTIVYNNLCHTPDAGSLALFDGGVDTDAGTNLFTTDGAYFEDVATGDFHLTADATNALDAGTAVEVQDDFDGVARAATPDIGAFEFVEVPSPPLPPPRGFNGGLQDLDGGLN